MRGKQWLLVAGCTAIQYIGHRRVSWCRTVNPRTIATVLLSSYNSEPSMIMNSILRSQTPLSLPAHLKILAHTVENQSKITECANEKQPETKNLFIQLASMTRGFQSLQDPYMQNSARRRTPSSTANRDNVPDERSLLDMFPGIAASARQGATKDRTLRTSPI